jgi:hypothetical protein
MLSLRSVWQEDLMTDRKPGYYWVNWTDRAEPHLIERRPAPLVGEWDGKVWWFARLDAYRFDCEVSVLGECVAREVEPLSSGREPNSVDAAAARRLEY